MITLPLFIPSYKRAGRVKTVRTAINKMNWDRNALYIVIDNETPDLEEYQLFAKKENIKLLIFDIHKERNNFDFITRQPIQRRTVAIARNFILKYARENNIKYCCIQDDDTREINATYCVRNNDKLPKIEKIINGIIEFMERHRIGAMALPQSGDLFTTKRDILIYYKLMNFVFYNTELIYAPELGILNPEPCEFTQLYSQPKVLKIPNYKINTIAWDTYPEDIPFTNYRKRKNIIE